MYKEAPPLYLPVTAETILFYPGLNTAKATIIILEIFAHCLPAGMIQYYNYFFEMPLFMAVSGFLVKETVFKSGFRKYWRYLNRRMFTPWLVAVVIYLPLKLGAKSVFQLNLNDFIYPFFHLWFIPAYALAAVICFIIIRYKLRALPFLIVTCVITAFWYVYFRDVAVQDEAQQLQLLGDKRFYAYLFFFLLGFSLRNKLVIIRLSPVPLLFIIISSFAVVALCVQSSVDDVLTVLPYLFFNFSLAMFVLMYVSKLKFLQNRFMIFMNKNSLGIYLFHPMIMIGVYYLTGDPNKANTTMLQGFLVGIATICITIPIVWLMGKWRFTSKYLLGNR